VTGLQLSGLSESVAGRNLSPGGLDIKPGRIYLITQDQCVDCPAAKAVVTEALDGSSIPLDIVDLKSIHPDFEFKLLENQVFISSTPNP
jgi:hypothetical protein